MITSCSIVSYRVTLGNLKERMRGQGRAGKNELPVAWQGRREGSLLTRTEEKERMAWGRMGEERRLEHIMIILMAAAWQQPPCAVTHLLMVVARVTFAQTHSPAGV